MLGKLPSNLVIILCIALLGGVLLLLGSITGTHSSQAGIMLLAPPLPLCLCLIRQVMVQGGHQHVVTKEKGKMMVLSSNTIMQEIGAGQVCTSAAPSAALSIRRTCRAAEKLGKRRNK